MLTIVDCKKVLSKDALSMMKALGNFCMSKLDILNQTIVVEFDDLADGMNGALMEYGEDDRFLIVIDPNRDLTNVGITLAHELTHVYQVVYSGFNQGMLGTDIPYLERWWEKEAIEKSRELVVEFVKEMK